MDHGWGGLMAAKMRNYLLIKAKKPAMKDSKA
jgi:hypothetical protein